MRKIEYFKACLCSFVFLFSASIYAETSAFRIECTADFMGKATKVAFEYNLKYPKTFGIGYGERARTKRLVAYDLVEVSKQKIEGMDIDYLAVYYNSSPYNDADYPNHKYVTQHKLSFYDDSTLEVSSAKLNLSKSKVEWVGNNKDKNFRSCVSICVW